MNCEMILPSELRYSVEPLRFAGAHWALVHSQRYHSSYILLFYLRMKIFQWNIVEISEKFAKNRKIIN